MWHSLAYRTVRRSSATLSAASYRVSPASKVCKVSLAFCVCVVCVSVCVALLAYISGSASRSLSLYACAYRVVINTCGVRVGLTVTITPKHSQCTCLPKLLWKCFLRMCVRVSLFSFFFLLFFTAQVLSKVHDCRLNSLVFKLFLVRF